MTNSAYIVHYHCHICAPMHPVSLDFRPEYGPARAGTVADLSVAADLVWCPAASAADEVWSDFVPDLLSMGDPGRVVLTPPGVFVQSPWLYPRWGPGKGGQAMEEKTERKRPTCHFCGEPLSKEDARISGGRCCFDCAIVYLGGAAHQMAEGIRAKKRAEEDQAGARGDLQGGDAPPGT